MRPCARKSLLLAVVVAASATLLVSAQPPNLDSPSDLLWPLPQDFTFGAQMTVDSAFAFKVVGINSEALSSAIKRYETILFPSTNPLRRSPTQVLPGETLKTLSINVLSADDTLDLSTNETYDLTVSPTGAGLLVAETVYGALHGLETFSQLLVSQPTGGYVTFVSKIHDFPRFPHRGVMIDSARHFLNVNIIKVIIDTLAFNKFSVLHWHLVDDQAFPMESKVFPDLAGKGAYAAPSTSHVYSQDTIRSIVAYGKERGVRVVPEIDTPGHTQSFGKGYPEVLTPCYSDGKPNGDYGPLNPIAANNYTFDFMDKLWGEVTGLFNDQYVHIGGDEVSFNCWMSNPDIQAWMAERKWTNYALLEQYYEDALVNIIQSYNRSYICWQEVFDNGVKINKETVVNVWKGGYQAELAAVTKAGYRTILSSPWYINYISYGEDWPKYWTVDPLDFDGTPEQKALVMGGETCTWAEFIDSTNWLSRAWPRASAIGERLWSAASVTNQTDATIRIHNHRCRLVSRGVPAEPPSGPSYCPEEYPTVAPPWVGA